MHGTACLSLVTAHISPLAITYRTKFRRTKHLSYKIFDTKQRFRQFCPIFAWLLYRQSFWRKFFFVRQNFRHHAEITTMLSDEFLSNKVACINLICCFLMFFTISWYLTFEKSSEKAKFRFPVLNPKKWNKSTKIQPSLRKWLL